MSRHGSWLEGALRKGTRQPPHKGASKACERIGKRFSTATSHGPWAMGGPFTGIEHASTAFDVMSDAAPATSAYRPRFPSGPQLGCLFRSTLHIVHREGSAVGVERGGGIRTYEIVRSQSKSAPKLREAWRSWRGAFRICVAHVQQTDGIISELAARAPSVSTCGGGSAMSKGDELPAMPNAVSPHDFEQSAWQICSSTLSITSHGWSSN